MYPEAYVQYLVHFHAHRDFFECHEILEEHWKKKDRLNREKQWVGLIQLAVGLYHQRRKNWRGAKKILQSARVIIEDHKDSLYRLALNSEEILQQVDARLMDIQEGKKYKDMNLPITDDSLIRKCKEECAVQQVIWHSPSDFTDHPNIHRHIWRRRPDAEEYVLRKVAKERKKLSRF